SNPTSKFILIPPRMTWPRPSFLELIQQFPQPLFIRMLEVGCDGGHCDARLDREQVDADQRDPGRRVDDDALIEDPVKHLNLSCGATHALDGHSPRLPGDTCNRSSPRMQERARKMPRVFRHLFRNDYKRFDLNTWLRICRNYARGGPH